MSDTTDQPTEPEAPAETPEPTQTPAPAEQTNALPTWPVIPPVAPHGYQQATGEFIA